MQKFIKGMTLTLLMTFLSTMIPSYNVVAKEKSTDSSVEVQQGTESDGLIVGEVTEKREENVKHFMKDDGTFVAMMYNNPVHYKEGSEWKDIDNTLVEKDDTKGIVESKEDILKEATIFSDVSTSEATTKTTEDTAKNSSLVSGEEVKESAEDSIENNENASKEKEILTQNKEVKVDSKLTEKAAKDKDKEINKSKNNKVLENKSNDFKISIAQNINADKLVSINKDKYEVSWNIKSDKNVKVNKKETTEEDVNNLLGLTKEQEKKLSKKEKAEIENSKKATLIKTTSSVVFEEVKPNINLEYKLISDSIKESIIINKPTDIKKFSFNFNMKNLKPELKDNQIILSDKDTGKEIMRMQAPFMVDAKGEQTDRVKLSFDKKGNGYVLTLELDKEWINSKDRQYPIIVDPSFESSVKSTDIRDTFVAANDNEDKSTNMFLRVGNTPQIGSTRTFIKFVNLPQLSMGDMIIDAKLYLLKIPSQSGTDGQIDVHKVTSDWNNVGLKWGNQPSIDWTIKDYQSYSNNNWQYWDITDIAKEWYTTGNNYGLCVKKNDERSGHSTYLSSDTSDSNGYPSVYFSYVNNTGLQPYWTYHSQSVGRAGTTNINDYNGNVIHVHDDVSMSGNRLPTVIKHVYNSNDRGEDIGFGAGWRLNLSQEIIYKQIGSKKYYQYTDEDGTRRYFEDTGTEMKEEYGGELTLTKNSNGTFTIKDKANNSLLFNYRYLEEIIDANGNKIDLQYDNEKLKRVVDGVGRVTRLEYSANNMLQEIYYPDKTKVRFDYYTNIMRWITYADGKQSVYEYNGQNNLTSVTNIDGYKMNYEYYSQSPNRIKKVTEGNTDGTVGASMSYEYSFNSTKFTDNKGNVNYYQFDNSGKTISIRDAAGYAQAYQYGDGTNVNKMTLESKLQKTVNNLIRNNSAEYDWGYYPGTDGGAGEARVTDAFSYLGKRSMMVTKTDDVLRHYINQDVSLTKGKTYTFSAYVKTVNVTNNKGKGALLVAHYKDKNGNYQAIRSKYITGSNDWTRVETTFTLPSDAAESTVILRVSIEEEKGTAYFDGFQLEEGPVANRLNLVDNSDMSGGSKIPNGWKDDWNNAYSQTGDTRLNTSDSDHPTYLDSSVFRLTGSSNKDTRVYTMLGVSGKAGDTFVVSGWGKGAAVAHGAFAIQPVFISSSGVQWESVNFNRDSKNWQYANGVIKAKTDYTDLHIYLTYSNNANEAFFDGIQVYKEEFGDTYQYDSKGNLISAVDLNKQNSKYEYNGSNDLIKTTDPKGNQFKYEYDGKKNITKATTAENLIYNFEYDSYGNAIKSKISGTSLFIESSAKYTYNGNYISSVTDSLGNTVGYNYDETKGTLTSTTDAKGNTKAYLYDNNNRLVSVSSNVSDKLESSGNASDSSKIEATYSINNVTPDGYDIILNFKSINKPVSTVYFPTWTVNNGQDDLIWGTGQKQGDGTWIYHVDRTEHKGEYGSYQTDIYAEDSDGRKPVLGVTNSINRNDANSNFITRISNVTSNGYDITATLVGSVSGITEVLFPTWSEKDGQDDLIWGSGTKINSNTWKYHVERNDHKGDFGKYNTHVYIRNPQNVYVSTNYVNILKPTISTKVANTSPDGYDIIAEVIPGSSPISVVKFPTWTSNNGQDDLIWKEGIKSGVNSWKFHVDRTEHKGEYGEYITHVYAYDNLNNSSTFEVINKINSGITNSYSYENDRIKSITHNGFSYGFIYDSLGRTSGVNVGSQRLITNTYEANGGNLKESTYGNGAKIQTDYDNLDRVISKKVNGSEIEHYSYDASGNLAILEDKVNNITYKYNYDSSDRLVNVTDSKGNIYKNEYDANNNVSKQISTINGQKRETSYAFDKDNKVTKFTFNNGNNFIQYTYDEIARNKEKLLNLGNNVTYKTTTQYIAGVNGSASTQVGTLSNNGSEIKYTYDKNGNIETITKKSETTKYYYNELNELIREDNQSIGKTILYNYDAGGNITSKREYAYTTGVPGTVTNNVDYVYGDSNWKDKLEFYNAKKIDYDEIGNLKNYDGYEYRWDRGRTLTKIVGNNKDISYKYDGSGIRTEKNANGVVSKYTLLGDKVVYEEVTNGSNVDKIYYTYDGSGNLVSMNLNSVEYYYVRNLQGDIIGLIDNTGKEVVTYNYDSWGKLITTEGSLKDTVGVKNPYRYRGYRYDNETGLYYLQSRYYNPEWGRFINADGLIGQTGDLLTHNMFAYCKNNPILFKDENGFRPMISTSWDNEVAIGRGSQEYDSYKGIWGSVTNIIKKQVIDIVYGSITYNKSVPIFSNGEVGISTPKIFKYQIKLGGSYTLGPYNKVDDSFYEFGVGAEVKPLEIAIREENNYGHLNINTEINPSVGLGGKASIGLARWDRGKYGVKFNLSGEKVVGGGATIEIYWDANNN